MIHVEEKRSREKRRPPRNYFSRREQIRLLVLVMTLGLVALLMTEVSDPENADWFSIFTAGPTGQTVKQQPVVDGRSPDTSYQPTLTSEEPGTIRITPTFSPTVDDTQRYFPGVVPADLKRVKDHRILDQPNEAAAWNNLWQVLDTNDSALINESSSGPVTFSQLYEQPQAFRGELVSLAGTVKQAEWKQAPKNNSAQIDGYYRLVLLMGKNQLLFLYVLELPEGFPIGENLNEAIDVTGFSYKVYLYYAKGSGWLAPVVLARDLNWTPTPVAEKTQVSTTALLVGVSVLALLAVAVACCVYASSKQMFRVERASSVRQTPGASIAALHDIQSAPTIGEQLSDMGTRD